MRLLECFRNNCRDEIRILQSNWKEDLRILSKYLEGMMI